MWRPSWRGPYWEPRDLWLGIYWDYTHWWEPAARRRVRRLTVYLCLVPCFPIRLTWRSGIPQ